MSPEKLNTEIRKIQTKQSLTKSLTNLKGKCRGRKQFHCNEKKNKKKEQKI